MVIGFLERFPVLHRLAAVLALPLLVSACGGGGSPATYQPAAAPGASTVTAAGPVDTQSYRLGSGDKIRVIVFGEDDLSGQFELDGNGAFSMPLVGEISAQGATPREAEQRIAAKLSEGYLRNPAVSVEVLTYRPFYIHGEVKNAGEYPFTNGLTIEAAVAKAGGYTYRANTSTVYIRRANQPNEETVRLEGPVYVYPGDTVRIGERFF